MKGIEKPDLFDGVSHLLQERAQELTNQRYEAGTKRDDPPSKNPE